MTPILPRFHRRQEAAADARRLTRRLLESGEMAPAEFVRATLPGDRLRLRGIPVVGAVGGTSPGTCPVAELLRRQGGRPVLRIVRNPQLGAEKP